MTDQSGARSVPREPMGWQCPRCQATHAPHVKSCCPPSSVTAASFVLGPAPTGIAPEEGLAQQLARDLTRDPDTSRKRAPPQEPALTDDECHAFIAEHIHSGGPYDVIRSAYHAGAASKPLASGAEPVATLHDDGYFSWKSNEHRLRYERPHAGWRLDVYAAPSPASEPLEALREENRWLRRKLCAVYAGPLAYMDDGEAQDGRGYPFIDFLRDTREAIEAAMQDRANRAAKVTEPLVIGWIVHGLDWTVGAIYNRSKEAEARDAAQRWQCSITPLVVHPNAPELSPIATRARRAIGGSE